jgi:carbonic anhydrase
MKTQTKETRQSLTPHLALQILKEGNSRFVNNLRYNRNLLQQVNETSEAQFPFALILSCMDSRTSAELIFDQGLGDIFCVRIAGNVLNDDILGSMEFACNVAGAKLILVLGHSNCGAVRGACNKVQMGHLTNLLEKIQPSVEKVLMENKITESHPLFIDEVACKNVQFQMDELLRKSSILGELLKNGTIGLAGGMYSIETGEVDFFAEKF